MIKDREIAEAICDKITSYHKSYDDLIFCCIEGMKSERERIIKELTKDCKTLQDGSIWPQPHIRLDKIVEIVRGK